MTDTQTIDVSASGKNALTLSCTALGQSMSYAACLNRISVVKGSARMPADWAPCNTALGCRQCVAEKMRDEEIAAGRALYFVARGAVVGAVEAARRWVSTWDAPKKPKAARRRDALDALGDAGSYADVVNTTPKAPAVIPIARAGETPAQMARRLAAERAVSKT
jgi:hypothetical protein